MSSIVRFDAETSLFVIGLRFGLGDLQFQWQAPHTRTYETPLAVAAIKRHTHVVLFLDWPPIRHRQLTLPVAFKCDTLQFGFRE
jgi:hypothetical protein